MFKQILSVIICTSFIASPMIALETNIPNWSTYLTSEQFGLDMLHVSDGALYIAFTTLMASITALTVYGTYKLICDTESLSQEANQPRPLQHEVIDLQVDINLHNQ